jgi:beta-galactosidase
MVHKNDVIIIEVKAIDTNGLLSRLAVNEITCKVSGAGELLGIENASNNVAENYTDNVHRLLNGRAVIYVRATDNQGKIQVEVESPYLPTEYLQIIIK